MQINDPNLPHLRQIAEALGELRERVVFVGGAVAGLLVTDPLASSVRATRDVDAGQRLAEEADRQAHADHGPEVAVDRALARIEMLQAVSPQQGSDRGRAGAQVREEQQVARRDSVKLDDC